MRTMARLPALLAFMSFALLFFGCSTPPQEPVRVGVLIWPPYELAFLAREEGFLDSQEIELVDYQTPAEMVRSYRFGLIDAMFTTSQFALANTNSLPDSRIVYAIDFSEGGDSLLAGPTVSSLADLEGKTIGMEAGPLGAYMMTRALDDSGLDLDDVNIHFIDTPDQEQAFSSGQLDAVVTYEPTRSRLLKQGAVELFSSREIPMEIVDVIIVKQTVIDSKRGPLSRFIRSLDRALQRFEAQPEASAAIMARREAISVEDFLLAMRGTRVLTLEDNRVLFQRRDTRLVDGLRQQLQVMQRGGMLGGKPEIDALLDASVIEAEQEK